MLGMAWRQCGAWWASHGLLAAIAVGVAIGTLAGLPLSADGETGAPGGSAGASCPSSNPANELTLMAGTPQTAMLEAAFGSGLQVALANSDGCPVTGTAGVAVTFSAPSSGASGSFVGSGSNTVTVGSDASGEVMAPTFTANGTAGSYTVMASSQYGSVSFSLTNTAAGIPVRILATGVPPRPEPVLHTFGQPLQARVLDANGAPVAGATVTFTLGSGTTGSSACGASSTPGASFVVGGTQASATTDSSGVASSPLLVANAAAGRFTATAAVAHAGSATATGAGAGGSSATIQTSFSLANLAGVPAKITAGVAASESTQAGARFPIRLAVTVTDAQKNPVAGAPVTFAAPARGPSGRFAVISRGASHERIHLSHLRAVKVRTDACGIALAPPLLANRRRGGYIVRATSGSARPAAFALVNEAPEQLP
jgi:protocatechuate 3,4-dioxygenase beta subunit